jgi:probable HAF family extracellular repeat protein
VARRDNDRSRHPPNHDSSRGKGINSAGQVAGDVFLSTVPGFDAVLWDDDEIIPLGTLGGAHGIAHAINQRGQVTGAARTPTNEFHAYLWDEKSGMTDLGALPGDTYSIGRGINNRGQVVGQSSPTEAVAGFFGGCPNAGPSDGLPRAVLWGDDGAITDLGTLGGKIGIAKSINARSVVVGSGRALRA